MNTEQQEKYFEVINAIGAEKIQQLYSLLGAQPVSMAKLHKLVLKNNMQYAIKKNTCISSLAKQLKVSRMTIYRQLRKKSQN